MSLFGIKISEFASSDEHYVSDDNGLFDWVLANNYKPSDREDWYAVQAPVGYVFWNDNLISEHSPKLANVEASELSKSASVTSGSAENDKALMLLEEAMAYIKPPAFYALGISDDRVLDYMIY